MPTFDRTAIFCRENNKITRIPWDLIDFPSGVSGDGPFISPMPISLSPFGSMPIADDDPSTLIHNEWIDMLYEDNVSDNIDDVTEIMWVESENEFYSKFDATFGFYDGNESQSAEFGYPRQ